MTGLPNCYQLRTGSRKDKGLLLQFMQITYQELFPHQADFSHLSTTVEQYFSTKTPLWWIMWQGEDQQKSLPVACLWMGNAINQVSGDRYGHIFLIYVTPEHRRRGLATALITHAQIWTIARGDHQLGLQVFDINQPALSLYHHLGFQTQSRLMFKFLPDNSQIKG